MKLVVDANIIFSLLIKEGKTKTAELFLNLSLQLYAPEFVLEEFEKHKEEILSKTNREEQDFNEILSLIRHIIKFECKEGFNGYSNYLEEAKSISPDENDIDYFALALKLNCAIWSNDKKLKGQDFIDVYSTEELAKMLEMN